MATTQTVRKVVICKTLEGVGEQALGSLICIYLEEMQTWTFMQEAGA